MSIARRHAEKMCILSRFTVASTQMIERRYWEILAEVGEQSATRRLRSVVPALRFTKEEAALLAKEDAKTRFVDSKYAIQLTRLVNERFWRVTIEWLPQSPDNYTFFDVSARNGEVVELFSLNEDFQEGR